MLRLMLLAQLSENALRSEKGSEVNLLTSFRE